MVSFPITYEDFNGVERTETYMFHFTPAELMDMQYTTEGGLAEYIQKIIDSKDQPQIAKMFKKIVLDSYGIRSDDGKLFQKNDKIKEEFAQSAAYSEIYMKLATDDEEGARFINGVIPDMSKLKLKMKKETPAKAK